MHEVMGLDLQGLVVDLRALEVAQDLRHHLHGVLHHLVVALLHHLVVAQLLWAVPNSAKMQCSYA